MMLSTSNTLAAVVALISSTQAHPTQLEPTIATRDCSVYKSYTALGDSYACGLGSKQRLGICDPANMNEFGAQCTTSTCNQDIGAYGYRFREQHNIASFQNLACSGADTTTINNTQINTPSFGDPDIVTFNMGGDDHSIFAAVVTACVIAYTDEECTKAMDAAQQVINTDLPAQYTSVFNTIKSKIRPETKVVALSYAQLWGSDLNAPALDKCGLPAIVEVPAAARSRMNTLVVDTNKVLSGAVDAAGFLYADVDKLFEGGRWCDQSSTPFLQTLPGVVGFDTADKFYGELSVAHPTFDGQGKMLEALSQALGC